MTGASTTRAIERTPIATAIGVLMACVTATLAVASLLHFGVTVLGVHDPFPGAKVPEAVIAAVLACGAVAWLARPSASWGLALGTVLFAVAGFLVGIRFTLFDGAGVRAGDILYHAGGLTMLLTTVALLLSPGVRGRRG